MRNSKTVRRGEGHGLSPCGRKKAGLIELMDNSSNIEGSSNKSGSEEVRSHSFPKKLNFSIKKNNKLKIDIFKLMSDFQIIEIKRRIASALLDRLKRAELQIILKKKNCSRKEDQIEFVIRQLKSLPFFMDKNLSYSDFRDLQ